MFTPTHVPCLTFTFPQAITAHGLTPEELAVFAESWLFREKQQRTFDGFFCADDVSAAFPWEFETLEGPNMPVPGGWQVRDSQGGWGGVVREPSLPRGLPGCVCAPALM